MYCANCGTKLSGNTNFCPHCGLKVNMQANANATSYSPAVKSTEKPARYNVFTLISAGITGVMIILFFMPWLVVEDESFNVFTILTILPDLYLIRSFPFLVCSVFILFSGGLLIAALILTLMKKGMSKGFVIASSVLIFITIFFFWFFDLMFEFASSSPVSVIMFILALVNIAFNELARKI